MASEKASGALSGAASGAAAGAAFGPWGAVIGGVVGAGAALLAPGQKAAPQAEFKPVDVQAEQAKALAGNLANFGQASTLSSKANSFNQSESTRLLEKALPGIGAIQQRLLGQVNADLNSGNNLPPELQQQIARQAAEKGVTRGTSGNFQQFSALKDFGFNLIDWKNASRARAMNTLSTVYGMAPRVNIMSPMSSMVDPNTSIQVAGQNNQGQQNTTQAGYNSATAATNYKNSQISGLFQAVGTAAGTYAGTKLSAPAKPAPQTDDFGN
jgi:hypothetical protein